ncbi:MAG: ABC transporter permease [Nitrososphaerales archaeon]
MSSIKKFLGFLKSNFFRKTSAKIGAALIAAILLLVLLGPFFIKFAPNLTLPLINSPPSLVHPFGTDFLGHDLLSQVVYGAYPSLIVSLTGAIFSVILGFFVGVFAGYFTKLEAPLSGATDVILTFPALPMMILIGTIYISSDILLAAMLVVFLWAPLARAVRAQVMSVKKLPFVETARISGMGSLRIVGGIIVPEVGSLAIAYFIINTSISIVLITALEFLGVGNPNEVSWGSILYWAERYAFEAGNWWWILIPGLMISLFVMGFALVGFSLEEIMNPRLKA